MNTQNKKDSYHKSEHKQNKNPQDQGQGAKTPKQDVTQDQGNKDPNPAERAGIDQQTRRAEDSKPSGLSASEMVRFRELENKPNITPEETEELRELGHKKQYGLPSQQYDQVKETASTPGMRPATEADIERERAESGGGQPDDSKEDE